MRGRTNVRLTAGLVTLALCCSELASYIPALAAGNADEYSVDHEIVTSWDGGYQAELTLNNLSDKDMTGWEISFTIPAEITDSWGGAFVLSDSVEYEDENEESVNNTYVVSAGEYNATVPAGDAITVGYVANGDAGDASDIEVDYTFVVDDSNDNENDDDENESDDSEDDTLTDPSGNIYAGNGYTVEVQIPQSWEHAYNAKLIITNTSDETLHNWGFMLKTDDSVTGLYNATELSAHDGTRLFKNAGYNQDIPAGGTVEVGYTAYYGDSFDVPSEFALASFERKVEMPEYRIETFVTDEWDDGALAEIVIENISDKAIEDWKLEFDSDMNISRIWDGVLVSHDGNHYIIRNTDYAQNIAAGDSWAVGMEINGSISDIENVIMTEIVVTDEAQLPDETTVSENTLSENTASENTADPDDIDYETDTDGDEIPDAYEEYFGTDKNDPDTDDDGLTDYEEIFIVGADPTVYDSVTSGVSDYDADIDGDGISNGAELQAGLDPLNEDSDFDGLKDGEEAGYGTDPMNPDTDGDGLDDWDDIALGFSPLMMDTDGNGILDCNEKVWQTYSYATEDDENITEIILDLHTSGKLDSTTEINNIMGSDVMSSGVVGLVGNPYDISTTSSFDSGVINFRINISELGGTEAGNLGVLWYDEKNDRYEILDSVWDPDKCMLSAEITHFSRYMVVDKEMWFAAWRAYTVSANSVSENSISDESIIFDTVFIVDCSSSMGKKDPTKYSEITSPQTYWYYDCYRYNVAYNFVTAMEEGDRAAIVTFATEAEVECNLTSDKNRLYRSIRDFQNAGATSFDVPLQKAYEMLIAYGNPEAIRQVILLSDGDAFVQPGILNSLNAAHIKVHTVCLGEPEYRYVLQHISEQTGGTFFDAYKATEVVDLYSQFGMDDDFDTTDTDCDGLPDAIESAGIRIANGQILFTDPTDSDSDDDGLIDGEEIDPQMRLITYTDLALQDLNGWYFNMKSDPNDADSDDDGLKDYYSDFKYANDEEICLGDNSPLRKGIMINGEVVSGKLTIVSCDNKFTGHGFLIYQSFVEDKLDLLGLTGGYTYDSWKKINPIVYTIHSMEYISIGNAGMEAGGGIPNLLEGPFLGDDKDNAGIYFNREFAYEYINYLKEYDANCPENFEQLYDKNMAYSVYITRGQFQKVIDYSSCYDYYNVIYNNCIEVAVRTWNYTLPKEERIVLLSPLPAEAKETIKRKENSFVFDIYSVLKLEI